MQQHINTTRSFQQIFLWPAIQYPSGSYIPDEWESVLIKTDPWSN